MDQTQLRSLLERVRAGEETVDGAVERLRTLPFEDIGFAKVDHHRALRHHVPEVIFGQGKTPEQVLAIATRLLTGASNILATRLAPDAAALVRKHVPDAEYFPASRVLRVWRERTQRGTGKIMVVSAGTTDLYVAEEAFVTAETMGNEVELIQDVGVAGLHRLLAQRERLLQARVIIACAGMEAALPSVLGGLVSCPVIAVPTAVGYGASFGGLAALLGMLNSCASNVAVVNIENGFGAAYVANLINR